MDIAPPRGAAPSRHGVISVYDDPRHTAAQTGIGGNSMNQASNDPREAAAWEALKEVMDPEVGINIVDMGLVYQVTITGDRARIEITMTSPSCPLHVSIAEAARQAVLRNDPSLAEARVEVVWDPPWTPERMSEEAKKILGRF